MLVPARLLGHRTGDNATTESFFGTLKTEFLHRRSWPIRRMAKDAVASYIEGFHNPYRLHSSLDYNSPIVFERPRDLKTAHVRESTRPLFLGKVRLIL